MNTKKTDTLILIKAMRRLADDIQSDDGVANAAIEEAADQLAELERENAELRKDKERLDYMEQNVDFVSWRFYGKPQSWDLRAAVDSKMKEAQS